jgi:hypothetical protein
MGKGLSKIQTTIVGLLDGSIKSQVYRNSGAFTTRELLEELIACGVMSDDTPHKFAMFTVRRACLALINRDILKGVYEIDCDYPWAQIATWSILDSGKK